MIVFLDFEASSLLPGSWPVEIGWAFDGGGVESHLLKPEPTWTDWDAKSEAIHGLSREYLREHGELVDLVARLAVDMLAAPGVTVFSDAASWDQGWLDRLLQEAGLRQNVTVHQAASLYKTELRRLRQLAPPQEKRWHDQVVRSLEVEAQVMLQDAHAAELARVRTRHRAGPDSAAMLWILQEVRARVDARLALAGL